MSRTNKILNTLLLLFYSIMVILLINPIGIILCESAIGYFVFTIFYILCVLDPIVEILKEIYEN